MIAEELKKKADRLARINLLIALMAMIGFIGMMSNVDDDVMWIRFFCLTMTLFALHEFVYYAYTKPLLKKVRGEE